MSPLTEVEVADLVADILVQCDRDPEQVALRCGSHSLGYRELGARVRTTAASLRASGLEPGDRVLFSVRPRIEGMVLALGIVAAGGSVVLIDPGSAPELFAARWGAARPTWAATESLLYALSRPGLRGLARRRGLLLPDYATLDVRHLYAGPRLPGVPWAARRAARLAGSSGAFRRGARGAVAVGGHDDRRPDGEALVVFTSGTTSSPRAVVHTRGSLGAGTRLLRQVCDLGPGDVVHTDQMLLGLPALVAGATWSLPRTSPAQAPAVFAREVAGAASSFLVPADVTAVLDAVEQGAVPTPGPRTMLVGGAPVSVTLLERGLRVWPTTRWVGVYGMTEVLPAAVIDAEEKIAAGGGADLVGRPLAGIGARIVAVSADDVVTHELSGDLDDVRDAVGELVLSGPSLMRGYLHDPGPAHEHRTGDLARWDDQGRIVLVGRTRDMLIRGLTNIYPGLFEPALSRLPGVREALIIGVPRPQDADEVVVLVVVPDRPLLPEVTARDPGEVVLSADPDLTRRLARLLPDVLDHSSLPDHVLVADRVPLSGRSRKPDRMALRAAAAAWIEREAGR